MSEATPQTLTELTVTLLAAFTQNNQVRSDDLPNLVLATHAALVTTAGGAVAIPPVVEAAENVPAVSIEKSIASRKFIISLIDGKPYKALKRHLSAQGVTPEQYRQRYNLPLNYPMVAPEYSESRREFAKNVGLGRSRQNSDVALAPAPIAADENVSTRGAATSISEPKSRRRRPVIAAT